MTTWFVFVVFIRTSLINAPDDVVIDSPRTFGLSKVVNQLKFAPIFAERTALTDAPLHISIDGGKESNTSGTTVTRKEESGPIHPAGAETGVTV
jgi:hypothetical protein